MIISKIKIEKFENIEFLEIDLSKQFVLIDKLDKFQKQFLFDAVMWGMNVYYDDLNFKTLLHEKYQEKLLFLESSQEAVKVSVHLVDNDKEIIFTKTAEFINVEDCVKLNEVKCYINGTPYQFSEFGEFCANYYNGCFTYLSFITSKKMKINDYKMDLYIGRFLNLSRFCDVEKERKQINKVANLFKLSQKQLILNIDEDLIPQWHRSKSGLYLNGEYSESEDILRKAYYLLALNRYLGKKHNRNLPIFLDFLDRLDSDKIKEFIITIKKFNFSQVFIINNCQLEKVINENDFQLIQI